MVTKSRLLLREVFRDWYQGKLPVDDAVVLAMAVNDNRHFLLDNHPKALVLLDEWSQGYTLNEIAYRHELHPVVVKNVLRFCFELLGRKLGISDGSVLRLVQPQLYAVARNVFSAYYETFTELPEKDMEAT